MSSTQHSMKIKQQFSSTQRHRSQSTALSSTATQGAAPAPGHVLPDDADTASCHGVGLYSPGISSRELLRPSTNCCTRNNCLSQLTPIRNFLHCSALPHRGSRDSRWHTKAAPLIQPAACGVGLCSVIDKSLNLEKSREEMTPYFLARSRKLDFHFSFYSRFSRFLEKNSTSLLDLWDFYSHSLSILDFQDF